MEQRDWELLDKQVWGLRPPRNDDVIVLTVVAVFFAGMILGGPLVPHESELVRIASNDAHCHFTSEWLASHCRRAQGRLGAAPTAWR